MDEQLQHLEDTARLDWLADIMVFHMADAGLPARWTLDFVDATGRDSESGTFDIETWRSAIDAARARGDES